jgi:hypothetical protein
MRSTSHEDRAEPSPSRAERDIQLLGQQKQYAEELSRRLTAQVHMYCHATSSPPAQGCLLKEMFAA